MSGRRILVGEDEGRNWMHLRQLLAKRGHRATNATDGRSVLALLESGLFDLAIIDCNLPPEDGYATARAIRRQEVAGGWRYIPMVAMSANPREGNRGLCLAAGMDDWLAKPIYRSAIDEVLQRWLPPDDELTAYSLSPKRLTDLRIAFQEEDISGVVDRLRREVNFQLNRIARALGDEDEETASEAAHRIGSSAHMIGAPDMAEAAIALQSSAQNRLEKARDIHVRLRREWALACVALEAELLTPVPLADRGNVS